MRIRPKLKTTDGDNSHGKRPHRVLAEKIGGPQGCGRTRAFAQGAASIPTLPESVATRWFRGKAPPSDAADFGSNHRDRCDLYGNPKVRAMLAAIVEKHGFVIAGEGGSTHWLRPTPPIYAEIRQGSFSGECRKQNVPPKIQ